MPEVAVDGIETHYEVVGDGPPLLMFSPGGFDATLEKWSTLGVYERTGLLGQLARKYRCIVFDRRESGRSGGRVEPVTWHHYVVQAKGLLEHLGIGEAHLLGGCMGCCSAMAFAVEHPGATGAMVLFWPVGGVHYRIRGHERFAAHLDFVAERGLAGVVEHARATEDGFGKDPRVGPWAPVIRRDAGFAQRYEGFDAARYREIVAAWPRALIDRDTAPGAAPEDLMRLRTPTLIVPGKDRSHATSAARYLEECISGAEYWDVPPEAQTAASAPPRILDFLDRWQSP